MTFDEALNVLSRDERFKATVYAMNNLLQQKGIYTAEEFEHFFCEHARNFVEDSRATKTAKGTSSETVSTIP